MNDDRAGPSARAAIAVGANLDSDQGSRADHFAAGVRGLAAFDGIRVLSASSVFETPPVGPPGQAPYLNGIIIAQTDLSPRRLLDALGGIELSRGRQRSHESKWGPRTLDLDLILYGDRTVDEPGLRVPHPRLAERAFVLVPLAEVAADWIVPGPEVSVRALLNRLPLVERAACRPIGLNLMTSP